MYMSVISYHTLMLTCCRQALVCSSCSICRTCFCVLYPLPASAQQPADQHPPDTSHRACREGQLVCVCTCVCCVSLSVSVLHEVVVGLFDWLRAPRATSCRTETHTDRCADACTIMSSNEHEHGHGAVHSKTVRAHSRLGCESAVCRDPRIR